MQKKLFLLDAMALIYRAFYALNKNPRLNSQGLNTSAIVGFANTLYDVIKKEKPTHIGVAFDTMAPTARHIDFVDYKANREKMPEDLSAAIPMIKELIEAFNIPVLFVDGYEADDVIGTLAKKAEKQGFITYMMTPDKDFGQLVTENILMYKPPKFGNGPEILGVEQVCAKFGIKRVDQVIDMLGLWGDASDNIPGIPGVGEVTAKKLLEEFDNIENLLTNIDQVSNEKLREKIRINAHLAEASKALATIITDVPIELDENALALKTPDMEKLKPLLEALEMRTFAKRVFTDLSLNQTISEQIIASPAGNVSKKTSGTFDLFSELDENFIPFTPSIQQTAHDYQVMDTWEKYQQIIDEIKTKKIFCFDTETTGLEPISDSIVGLAICLEATKAYYIPFPEDQNKCREILHVFAGVFADPEITKVGQNLKFDIRMLMKYHIVVKGKLFDTMLAHYLIDPESRHNLDFLAKSYLSYEMTPIESLIGKKGNKQGNMRMVPLEDIKEYAGEDADITWQLKPILEKALDESFMISLFDKIEMPLMPVLADMEQTGVKVDTQNLFQYAQDLNKEIIAIESQIYELAGIRFNIASPKQLGDILFNKLKLTDKPLLTKTKQYATGEDILQGLVNKHPIAQLLLDYRSLTKLKSTYVEALPAMVNIHTGRIHTSYNQAVTSTGRLSSNNPNLQNIPIRSEKGREIRKAFVPKNTDYTLLSADYSQVELRLIAHLSGDESMMQDFKENKDIHTATAAKVYHIPFEEVTKLQRSHAKAVNFGIVYGISAFGLGEQLGITSNEAKAIIQQYFKQYPGVQQYMQNSIEFAKTHGYVETICGRRRYLRDILSANKNIRGFAERNAINAPVQGSSADLIKLAMIHIFEEFNKRQLKSKMIMQVHDELVFDVYKPELEEVKQIVKDRMEHAMHLNVPLIVDMNTGNNWLEAH